MKNKSLYEALINILSHLTENERDTTKKELPYAFADMDSLLGYLERDLTNYDNEHCN